MKKLFYLLVVVAVSSLSIACVPMASNRDISSTQQVSTSAVKQSRPEVKPTPVPVDSDFRQWKGVAGTYQLNWTGNDLFFRNGNNNERAVFSPIAKNYCEALKKGEQKKCYCSHAIKLVSVVGTILSIDDEQEFSCQGSYSHWRFASLDLDKKGELTYPRIVEFESDRKYVRRPSKFISLDDLFSEADLLTALEANREIAEQISNGRAEKRLTSMPETLADLDRFLLSGRTIFLGGEAKLLEDYLSRFAFHHIEGDKVAVWISLSSTSHVGQAARDHLEILLPIPESLRQALDDAERGRQGFLMKDAEKYVGTSSAFFESTE